MSMKSMGEIGEKLTQAESFLSTAKTWISDEDQVDRGDESNLAYLSTFAAEVSRALAEFTAELALVQRRAAGGSVET